MIMSDHRIISTRRVFLQGLGALSCFSANGHAQETWPSKTVTILVPYAAGGIADLLARLSAEMLSKKFGKPFIIENRVAGGGIIAAHATATARADGYTLLLSPPGPIVTAPFMQNVNYTPEQFSPLAIVAQFPLFLTINAKLGINNFQDFIEYAKKNPTKLNYASGGSGSVSHIVTALLAKRAGIQIVHVPYKGSAPATNDLIGGHVDLFLGTPSELLPHIESKSIVLLATSGNNRLPAFKDVPTIAEFIKGFQVSAWNGLLAPPAIPEAIANMISETIGEGLKDPATMERLAQLGVYPGTASRKEFSEIIKADQGLYKDALEAANLSAQ